MKKQLNTTTTAIIIVVVVLVIVAVGWKVMGGKDKDAGVAEDATPESMKADMSGNPALAPGAGKGGAPMGAPSGG